MTARADGNLRQLFREKLPEVHWQAIETGGTGRGVPDSNGCWRGREFWVEYKRTGTGRVPLRPEQVGWLSRRGRGGGRVRVAVRQVHKGGPRKGPPVDALWLLEGVHAVDIVERGLHWDLASFVIRRWDGGPSRWDWDRVLWCLTHP